MKITFMGMFMSMLGIAGCSAEKSSEKTTTEPKKLGVQIIIGSTREGRISDKISKALQAMVATRTDITTEIIDLRDYKLPFLYDATPPMQQEKISDPVIQKWSDKIKSADAFIIVVPEYNSGYPGVLKNALDLLYKEWNNKPVGLVGHSGGPSGGTSVLAQMRTVTKAFKMIPVMAEIKIPSSWKALDTQGNLVDQTIPAQLNTLIDQLIAAR